MQFASSILDLVGDTPLVRISRLTRDLGPAGRQPLLLAKLEMLNPGGSVKDRIGLPMIEAAERAGLLRPGGTIIEPTSGNTGHGLAIAAALKGYRCVFVMADKQSSEKQALLRAYGAEVVLCPTDVAPESPESYYSVAARLARDIPGAFKPDQYWNPENPAAHEATTGPELWRQTDGRISHLVASVGTGGTISGTARFLRAQDPSIRVVGADPEGSVLSGDTARSYLTEGVGEDFFPGTYDPAMVDRWVRVSDRDAFAMARRLTREEGILAGGSCGTAMVAALDECARIMREQPETAGDAVVVVILPDTGRNYLSKVYNDEWLRTHGLLATTGAVVRVGELLGARHHGPDLPPVVLARTTDRVGRAIDLLQEFGISQLPVSEQPGGDDLEGIVGSVSERGLLDRAYRDPSVVERTLGEVMDRPLPTLEVTASLDEAFALLAGGAAALLAVRTGRPAGVVSRLDLLEHLPPQGLTPGRIHLPDTGAPSHEDDAREQPAHGVDSVLAIDVDRSVDPRVPRARAADAMMPPMEPDDDAPDAFATRAVHAGAEPDALTGAISPPIYQTATYAQDGVGRPRGGYEYARTQNPTRERLERAVADLEGGRHGIAFASGSAATSALAQLAAGGEEVLVGDDVYGGTYRYFEQVHRPAGAGEARYADLASSPDALWEGLTPATRLVWLETPSNPLLKVTDIAASGLVIREWAAGAGRLAPLLVIDNTFASPALQRPLELGADVVFHSATKYLGGHSDTVLGVAVTSSDAVAERLRFLQNAMGAVPGPFDCFLVLRGLRTLALRMERHSSNALAVARFLAARDDVAQVRYPGLGEGPHAHPGHVVAARQMRLAGSGAPAFGGMVSFVPAAGGALGRSPVERAVALSESTRLFALAESLGGVESLVEVPAAMTHASVASSSLAVDPALVRLSVGIEDAADLVADLARALDRA